MGLGVQEEMPRSRKSKKKNESRSKKKTLLVLPLSKIASSNAFYFLALRLSFLWS